MGICKARERWNELPFTDVEGIVPTLERFIGISENPSPLSDVPKSKTSK